MIRRLLVTLLFLGVIVAPAAPAGAATDPDPALRARITELLPADHRARLAALERDLDLADDELQDIAERVIDPADYECASTPLFDWLEASVADWSDDDLANADLILTLDPVLYDALLFPEPARGRFFGLDGEYTTTLRRSFGNLQRFWDIDGSRIELVPAHGSMLLDEARVARVLRVVFELTEAEAAEAAAAIAAIVDQPQFGHGDHPLFTFNAFAFSAEGMEIPGVGVPTDKIVMGDGILDGFRALGLGDTAPNAVLGHEYGHHIQYQRDLFDSPLTGPEATRRTELMADSFSSYHASHLRGDRLRWTRTRQVLRIFYNLGDCAFDYEGHHGTPKQRLRAADWGHDMAVRAVPPTRVLPSTTFARLFERKLPSFVAPDAR